MSVENKVAVITDSGSSVLADSPLAKEYDVISVPLDIKFIENNHWINYSDGDLTPAEFYDKMRQSSKLPQTSGAITGKMLLHLEKLARENRPTISIHITSHHSTAWESAVLASKMALEKHPHLLIEILDSKQVSIATWFLVEQAAVLAQQGHSLEDIKKITLETIPKIDIFTSLNTFENVVRGGRLPGAAGFLGNKLHLKPIVGVVDGEIKFQSMSRTQKHIYHELAKRVENTKGEIIKLAIVHTNFEEGAQILKTLLSDIYSGPITIHEAGPLIGVHAGEKGLGIALQRA